MSNLPPGVTVDMLPGNTPEDEAWDEMIAEIADNLASDLSRWHERTGDRWDDDEILDAVRDALK